MIMVNTTDYLPARMHRVSVVTSKQEIGKDNNEP